MADCCILYVQKYFSKETKIFGYFGLIESGSKFKQSVKRRYTVKHAKVTGKILASTEQQAYVGPTFGWLKPDIALQDYNFTHTADPLSTPWILDSTL